MQSNNPCVRWSIQLSLCSVSTIFALLIMGSAPTSSVREAWNKVLNTCASSDLLGKNVIYFGPSNNVGPGSVWRKNANGSYELRRLTPTTEKWRGIIKPGTRSTCLNMEMASWSANSKLLLESRLAPIEGELAGLLSKATEVTVKIDGWSLDQLIEGPFEDIVFSLPSQDKYRKDLLADNRLIITKSVRIKGFVTDLKFSKEDALKLKVKLTSHLTRRLGNYGIDVKANSLSDNVLRVTSSEEFYIAGEFGKFTPSGFALGGSTYSIEPVSIIGDPPVGVDIRE